MDLVCEHRALPLPLWMQKLAAGKLYSQLRSEANLEGGRGRELAAPVTATVPSPVLTTVTSATITGFPEPLPGPPPTLWPLLCLPTLSIHCWTAPLGPKAPRKGRRGGVCSGYRPELRLKNHSVFPLDGSSYIPAEMQGFQEQTSKLGCNHKMGQSGRTAKQG